MHQGDSKYISRARILVVREAYVPAKDAQSQYLQVRILTVKEGCNMVEHVTNVSMHCFMSAIASWLLV